MQSVMIYDTSGKSVTEIRNPDHTISLKDLASRNIFNKMIMKDGTSHTVKAIKEINVVSVIKSGGNLFIAFMTVLSS